MVDYKKVTSGLEHCTTWAGLRQCQPKFYGYDCPYDDEADCGLALMQDALSMLKEQHEEIENLKQTAQNMMEGICLIKEQEVKTGHWIDTTKVFGFPRVQCSVCGSEQGAMWMYYCPICGAKMQEDGEV